MDLDHLGAAIRPRTPWEGVDLGFALARHWFWPLWALWWLTALPLGALVAYWLGDRPDLWMFTLWWFKPLFEALPLLWLGRALFGAPQALGRGPLGWAGAVRSLVAPTQLAGLLPYLLWRRLAPARSLDLPVGLLEGLRGKAQRDRRRVLHGGDGTGGWLTLICVHLEMILALGAVLGLFFLVPEELPRLDLKAALFDAGSWAYWMTCLVSLLAMSVMAPFYLAGGFALYLTKRTRLEAWDLELVFRRAAEAQAVAPGERRRTRARGLAVSGLVPILLMATLLPPPGPAQAAQSPHRAQAKTLIGEVLAGPDFGSTREVQRWTYVGVESEPDTDREEWGADLPRLHALLEWLRLAAEPIRWGLALAAAVLVALLLRKILRDLPTGGRGRRRTRHRPGAAARSMGSNPSTPALPNDIPAAARGLLAAGEARAALALLYRAGVARLRALGLTIPPGATEGECLHLAAQTRPAAEVAYLRRLTRLWQGIAYADRQPQKADLDSLLAQWQDWGASAENADREADAHAP